MTTYTVYFRTDAESASHDIEADTPEQALALARELDAPGELWFDPCNGIMPVNEIVVCDPDGKEAAHWHDGLSALSGHRNTADANALPDNDFMPCCHLNERLRDAGAEGRQPRKSVTQAVNSIYG